MSECPYFNENMISLYVENLLSEEENIVFEKHLMSCDICLRSVLDVRNDLYKIKLYEQQLYRSLYLLEAVFMIFKNRLIMLKDTGYKYHFKKINKGLNLKGKAERNYYNVEVEDIDISISRDTDNRFLLNFKNIKGRRVELFRDNRLVEAHTNIRRGELVIGDLNKGDYIIVISENNGNKISKMKIRVN